MKPEKWTDRELWRLMEAKIEGKSYVFLSHAKKRLKERGVIDLDILDILQNRDDRKRKRNKRKDVYSAEHQDWNYCIEGRDYDNQLIRIIVSFDENLLLIITVIKIEVKK